MSVWPFCVGGSSYRIQSNYSDTLDIEPNVPFNFVLALNMRQFQCLNIIFWRFDN